jgi:hypothetical protein
MVGQQSLLPGRGGLARWAVAIQAGEDSGFGRRIGNEAS